MAAASPTSSTARRPRRTSWLGRNMLPARLCCSGRSSVTDPRFLAVLGVKRAFPICAGFPAAQGETRSANRDDRRDADLGAAKSERTERSLSAAGPGQDVRRVAQCREGNQRGHTREPIMNDALTTELLQVNQRLLDSIADGDWAVYQELCDPTLDGGGAGVAGPGHRRPGVSSLLFRPRRHSRSASHHDGIATCPRLGRRGGNQLFAPGATPGCRGADRGRQRRDARLAAPRGVVAARSLSIARHWRRDVSA